MISPSHPAFQDRKSEELLALLDLAKYSDPSLRPVGLRHIPSERLSELLSSISLESLLYSPLGGDKHAPPPFRCPRLLGFRSDVKLGLSNRQDLPGLSLDLRVRSIEHQFSVYGHKIWLADADDFVPAAVFCSAAHSSGKYVVTGADDFLVKIWSVETGRLVSTLRGHTAEVCELKFSPCMRYLVSSCQDDKSVIIWREDPVSVYAFHRRITESDISGKKLRPVYLDFVNTSQTPKLVIAYGEGLIVVFEILHSGTIVEFTRFSIQTQRMEIDYFTLLPSGTDSIALAVGVTKKHVGRMLLSVSLRARGNPKVMEYTFPGTSKAKISQISSAHHSASFVANDDELAGSVVLFREVNGSEYEKIFLLREGFLIDGSPIGAHIERSKPYLKYSANESIFSKNDEFVIAAIIGHPRNPTSIGEDDQDSLYFLAIFSADSGMLLATTGNCRDQIFSTGSLSLTNTVSSYIYFASYDGSLTFLKLRSTLSGLAVEILTSFNLNTDHGANLPRSILDCQILEKDDGEILVVAGDALGAVSVLTNAVTQNLSSHPVISEQFFHTDYDPLPSGVEGLASGGILCDSRGIRLEDLPSPSPPIVGPVSGSDFLSRFSATTLKNLELISRPIMGEIKKIENQNSVGPGRPRLSDLEREQRTLERQRRDERLSRLAALRQQAAAQSPERNTDSEVRTSRGRVVRRISILSEIDDSFSEDELSDSVSDSSGTDSTGGRRRSVRTPSRASPGRRGRPRRNPELDSPNIPQRQQEQTGTMVPTQMRREEYLRGLSVGKSCTLCGQAGDTLGPFPIADLEDSFFHAKCLFSLTGLTLVGSTGVGLTFGNLDTLVRKAVNMGRCGKPGGCPLQRPGAGVKCYNCAFVFHYDCAKDCSKYKQDPLKDVLFVCHRCDPPSGLGYFARGNWRRDEKVRSWIYDRTSYLPQIGDEVYYFPPLIEGNDQRPLTDLFNSVLSAEDLSVLTWWSSGRTAAPISAKIEKIDFVFPSFFDNEYYGIIMRVGLRETGGKTFCVHYRPHLNAGDCLVLKEHVDRALETRLHITARVGTKVTIPIDNGEDFAEGKIVGFKNENNRRVPPGWECFEIEQIDGQGQPYTSTFSVWELSVQPPIQSGISDAKSNFFEKWIQRIVKGPVRNPRNRIDIGEGMDIFQFPPWTSEGAESYLLLIECPVWLDLIVEKLKEGAYRSKADLKRELDLIEQNCAFYNERASPLVAAAQNLVRVLKMLLDLSEADHALYIVPPLPSVSSDSARGSSYPTSIRVERSITLVCDHCGAEREVGADIYNDFTETGKRVKCRWIGYICDTASPSTISVKRIRSSANRR